MEDRRARLQIEVYQAGYFLQDGMAIGYFSDRLQSLTQLHRYDLVPLICLTVQIYEI